MLLFVTGRSPQSPTCGEPAALLLGSTATSSTAPLEFRLSLDISLMGELGRVNRGPVCSVTDLGAEGVQFTCGPSGVPLPRSRQVTSTPRTPPVSDGPSDRMHIHLRIMLCDSRVAEHHFNMQIDSSEALHYAFSGLFSD